MIFPILSNTTLVTSNLLIIYFPRRSGFQHQTKICSKMCHITTLLFFLLKLFAQFPGEKNLFFAMASRFNFIRVPGITCYQASQIVEMSHFLHTLFVISQSVTVHFIRGLQSKGSLGRFTFRRMENNVNYDDMEYFEGNCAKAGPKLRNATLWGRNTSR